MSFTAVENKIKVSNTPGLKDNLFSVQFINLPFGKPEDLQTLEHLTSQTYIPCESDWQVTVIMSDLKYFEVFKAWYHSTWRCDVEKQTGEALLKLYYVDGSEAGVYRIKDIEITGLSNPCLDWTGENNTLNFWVNFKIGSCDLEDAEGSEGQ